jgi:hypothetical protein
LERSKEQRQKNKDTPFPSLSFPEALISAIGFGNSQVIIKLIEKFVAMRQNLLRPPADPKLRCRLIGFEDFKDVDILYSKFDGETFHGAFVPGIRMKPLVEVFQLMDDTSDAWDNDDGSESAHFMHFFLPLFSSSLKTSIGPVLCQNSMLSGQVISYAYETGRFRRVAESFSVFGCALMSYSLEKRQEVEDPFDLMNGFSTGNIEFTEADINYFQGFEGWLLNKESKWTDENSERYT